MKKIITLAFLIAMAIQLHGQDKTIQKNFSGIKSVYLSTSSGNIIIRKSDGVSVNVTITHTYDAEVFTPVIDESNGKLTMKEQFVKGDHSGNSSWTVAVPDNAFVSLNSGSGNIKVDGVNVDVESNVGSGDIEVSNVKGLLRFNTGSGDISLEDAEGELAFNTGSGDILANGGRGTFQLNAGSGDIELSELHGTFQVNTGSGDIATKNFVLEGPAKFNSGSGDAIVRLSGPLNHSIDVSSGSGDAKLSFNGIPIEGEVIMTADERNGDIIAPFKFDSEETLQEGNSSPRIRKIAKLGNKDIQIRVSTGSGTAEIIK